MMPSRMLSSPTSTMPRTCGRYAENIYATNKESEFEFQIPLEQWFSTFL